MNQERVAVEVEKNPCGRDFLFLSVIFFLRFRSESWMKSIKVWMREMSGASSVRLGGCRFNLI
jgi:hypothetical protein